MTGGGSWGLLGTGRAIRPLVHSLKGRNLDEPMRNGADGGVERSGKLWYGDAGVLVGNARGNEVTAGR